MTEYGVQTNNLFDVLDQPDEIAKPKPKTNKRKKRSQRGKAPGQTQPGQAPTPTQPAKATTTTQSSATRKPDSQPGTAKPQQAQAQVRPTQPVQQPVKPAGGSFQIQEPVRRPPTQGQGVGGRGTGSPITGGRGSGRGQARSPGQGRPQGQARAPGQGRPTGSEEYDPKFVRKLDQSHVTFDEEAGKVAGRGEGARRPERQHFAPVRGRTFDRQSGTGFPPTANKKGGAGAANWGKPGVDELVAEEDLKVERQGEQAAQAEAKQARKKNKKKKPEEAEAEKKEEVSDESLLLWSDWEAMQKKKAAKLVLPKARAAGEGVSEDPKWSGAVKLDKDAQAEEFVKVAKKEPQVTTETKKTKSQIRRERRRQAAVEQEKKLAVENINTLFDFSAKPDEGGRGRGRERGGRHGSGRGNRGNEGEGRFNRPPREGGRGGRGAPKMFRPENDAPHHLDEKSFPALHVGPPITAQ